MHWHAEHSLETDAPPAAIWSLMSDVDSWPSWNRGVEQIALDGPFETGTWFTMTLPGEQTLRTQLIDVVPLRGFTDQTLVDELDVTVAHLLEPCAGGRTRIVYRISARGPNADEIGPAIASDFPEVLTALAAAAQAGVR